MIMYVSDLEGSPSLEVVNIVLDKLSRGEKLTSLAIGEPMYDTPEEIIEVAYREMKKGNTHYTSSYGTPDVRKAVVDKVQRKNSINAELKNAMFITSKQAIHSAFMAIAGKKSEFLVPDPGYFFSEPAMLAGLSPIKYKLSTDNTLDLDEIRNKVGKNTAGIIINSPSNPTGRVLSKDALQELLDLAREHDFKIISDEAYEDLVYEKEHVSIGSLEESPEHVISIFTLSKSYAMTGWRSGYTVASDTIISNMAKVIEHTYTCSPPFIQNASAFALEHGDKYIEKFRNEFREKRDYVYKKLNSIDGIQCGPMEGAFYAFPQYEGITGSSEIAKGLLNKYSVALLPGVAFGEGGEHHLRISYSGSRDTLETGIEKLEKYMKEDVS